MKLRVLIVEPDADDLLFLESALCEIGEGRHWTQWLQVETHHAVTWQQASAILTSVQIDAVLLNLNLPDSRGVETFRRGQALVPQVPFILLVGQHDRDLAAQLIRDGAQDFLLKDELDCHPLIHAIENAMERQRVLSAARAFTMMDPLTGLLNRVGFHTFAVRDRMLAERLGLRFLVVAAEPASFTSRPANRGEHNTNRSQQNLDLALVEAADQLRSVAGSTGLLARLSETRFALVLFETPAEPLELAWKRLEASGAEANPASKMSMGSAIFDGRQTDGRPTDGRSAVTLEALLEQAESNLRTRAAQASRAAKTMAARS